MEIYFVGMIPGLVYNFAASVLRAVGDTKRPMYFLTLAGVLNVLLNLLFVIALKMDVAGVALATVISQTVSATLTVICLMRESEDIRLVIKKLSISKNRLLQIIAIGLPSGLHSTMFNLANVVIQSSINAFGAVAMAGNGASGSVESLLFTALGAISQAIVSFTSQNFGRYNYKRIVKAHVLGQVIVFTFGFAMCVLTVVFAEPLISLYADDPAEIAAGVAKLQMIGILTFIYSSSDLAVATMRGMGSSLTPTLTSLICVCGARLLWIATIFQLPEFHTLSGLYFAFPLSYVLSFVVQMVCLIITYKRIKKRHPAPTLSAV
jgi:Na+-driven multidrug efflux pump